MPRKHIGKYTIRRRLAQGGFGAVYEAYDTIEGCRVALKIPLNPSPDELDDFIREVQITASLDHPNILRIKDADFIDGTFVVAQPLGQASLDRLLGIYLSRSLVVRLSAVEQLLAGLAHAHARGVIHCDVKPDNLILFPGGRWKIGDFGIARRAQATITGSGSGTVGFSAPEQVMGLPSPRSDVFSAGLVLHQLLTGELPRWPFEWPFPGDEALREYYPGLQTIVRKSLKVDSRKRYPDAGAMHRALTRVFSKAVS